MKKKLLAAVVSASLVATPALPHTNSIGYVSDASGNVTFWYGTYHYTSFNEAELKLEGANGTSYTTTITQFNELSSTTPNGLFPGTNYFTTDGTSLITYSDSTAAGGQSNTWQGLTFNGLSTGDYTFTYIPLGDTESYQPNGSPTMDWAPWDEVIRTYTVSLNAALLSGDANQNGILDSLETSPASNGPVVTYGTGTRSYTRTDADSLTAINDALLQTVSTYNNSSSCTQGTVTTLHDGVVQSSLTVDDSNAPTCSANDPTLASQVTGRVDQIATAQDVVGSVLRTTDFTRVNAVTMDNKYDNGMNGSTRGVVAGAIDVKENNIIVGGGVAKLNTDMSGNGDTVKGETTAVSGVVGKRTERGDLTARLTHGMTDYTMTRTIGTYANAGATEGTDTSISLRFEGVGKEVGKLTVSPIVGVTKGKRTIDAYTETGSTQSARTVAETSENYTYGTIGASIDVGLVNLVALHNTDGVNDFSAGISKETDKVTWNLRAHRTTSDLGDTNSISLGLSIKF